MKKQKILASVIAAHFAVLIMIAVKAKTPVLQPTKIITIQTYKLTPPKPKKIAAKPKPKPAPSKPKKAHDVMKDLQKNIAKIEKKRDKTIEKKPTSQPKVVYSTLLAQKLKSALNLPEEGDVKLSLKVKNSGEVIEVNVLSSQSVNNASYLKEEIPKIRFPTFKGELLGKKEHTFTLTFCHDD